MHHDIPEEDKIGSPLTPEEQEWSEYGESDEETLARVKVPAKRKKKSRAKAKAEE